MLGAYVGDASIWLQLLGLLFMPVGAVVGVALYLRKVTYARLRSHINTTGRVAGADPRSDRNESLRVSVRG